MQLQAVAAERGERVTNIVMMGMGEPLLNYDEVTQALRIIKHSEGPAIGGRRMTVSTAGYLPGIRRLTEDDLNVGLAISLNATTDTVRERLMPINRKSSASASRPTSPATPRRIETESLARSSARRR